MTPLSADNFGLLIAYLIPGFMVVTALSGYSPTIVAWLGGPTSDAATVGGFLYVTLASVAAGVLVSALACLGPQVPEREPRVALAVRVLS